MDNRSGYGRDNDRRDFFPSRNEIIQTPGNHREKNPGQYRNERIPEQGVKPGRCLVCLEEAEDTEYRADSGSNEGSLKDGSDDRRNVHDGYGNSGYPRNETETGYPEKYGERSKRGGNNQFSNHRRFFVVHETLLTAR